MSSPAVTLALNYYFFSPEELRRYLGGVSKINENLLKISRGLEQQVQAHQPLRGRVAVFPINSEGIREIAGTQSTRAGPSQYFLGATAAALLVCTAGRYFEESVDRLFRSGDYLEALILDAISAIALNQAVGQAREYLAANFSSSRLGYTLNPGCHQLRIEVQKTIFRLLRPELIGVRLTDVLTMSPAKSISAVIPLGEELVYPGQHGEACAICDKYQKCAYRFQKNIWL